MIGCIFGIFVIKYFILFRKKYKQKTNHGVGTGINNSTPMRDILKILTRQTARWTVAAKQDRDQVIAALHANYGAAYLWAIRDIATHAEVQQSTGVDLKRLTAEVVQVQDTVNKRLVKCCRRTRQTRQTQPTLSARDYLETVV